MESTFWERVAAQGQPPSGYPLGELTTELTTMLGDTDPHRRDGIACELLGAWVADGVYDDLLEGLGDGMATGLLVGLGENGTDTVFRRSFSALVLSACIARDNAARLLPGETVLGWGDRLAGWLLREQDLRGYVVGKGWAHAVAHGADGLGELAASSAVGAPELAVLLDVLADRLLAPTEHRFVHGEDDRLARAAMEVLRRDGVPLETVERWLDRLAEAAELVDEPGTDPYRVAGNVRGFLKALHLQLALSSRPPACRADLLLTLIGHLKRLDESLLG